MPTDVDVAGAVVPAKMLVLQPGSASFRKELMAEVVLVLTDLTMDTYKYPLRSLNPSFLNRFP